MLKNILSHFNYDVTDQELLEKETDILPGQIDFFSIPLHGVENLDDAEPDCSPGNSSDELLYTAVEAHDQNTMFSVDFSSIAMSTPARKHDGRPSNHLQESCVLQQVPLSMFGITSNTIDKEQCNSGLVHFIEGQTREGLPYSLFNPPSSRPLMTMSGPGRYEKKIFSPASLTPGSLTAHNTTSQSDWGDGRLNAPFLQERTEKSYTAQLPMVVSAPVQEMVSAPVQEMASTPVQDLASLPVQWMVSSPEHEMVYSREHEMVSSPEHEMVSSPGHEIVSSPEHEMVSSPEHEMVSSPEHEMVSSPEHEMLSSPEHEMLSSPEHEMLSSSEQEMISSKEQEMVSSPEQKMVSSKEQEMLSSKEQEIVSSKEQEMIFSKEKGMVSSKEQEIIFSKEQEIISLKEQEIIFSKEQEMVSSKEQEMVSSKEQEMVSSKEQEMVSSKEQEMVSSKEQEIMFSKEQEMVSSREQEMVSSREQEMVSSREQEMVSSKEQEMVSSKEQEMVSSKEQEMVSLKEQEMVSSKELEMVASEEQKVVSSPMDKMVLAPDQRMVSAPLQGMVPSPVKKMVSAPVQERASAPVQERAAAPVLERASASVPERASAQVQERASAQVQERASVQMHKMSPVPVHGMSSGPVQKKASAPVQEMTSAPVQEMTSAPVQVMTSAPVQEMTSAPVQEMTSAPVQVMTSAPVQVMTSAPVQELASVPELAVVSAPAQECASAHLINESVVQCAVEPLKLPKVETTSDGTMLLQTPSEVKDQAGYLKAAEVNPTLGLSYDVLILEPSESSIADMFMDSVAEQLDIQDSSRVETTLDQLLKTDHKAYNADGHVETSNPQSGCEAIENSNSFIKLHSDLVEVEHSCPEDDFEHEKMKESCSENQEVLEDDNSRHNTADQELMEESFHHLTLVEDYGNSNNNNGGNAPASAVTVEMKPYPESRLVESSQLTEACYVQDVKLHSKCCRVQLEKLDLENSQVHLEKSHSIKNCHVRLEKLKDDIHQMGSETCVEKPHSFVAAKSAVTKHNLEPTTGSSMVIETQNSISLSLPKHKISFKINKKQSKLTTQYQRSDRNTGSGRGLILRDICLGSNTVGGLLEKPGNGHKHVQSKEAAEVHQSSSKSKPGTPRVLNDSNKSSRSAVRTSALLDKNKIDRQVRTDDVKDVKTGVVIRTGTVEELKKASGVCIGTVKNVKPAVVVRTGTVKEVKKASGSSIGTVKDVKSALQVNTGSVKVDKKIVALQTIPSVSLPTKISFKIPKKKTTTNQSSTITLDKVLEASSEGEIMKLARGIIGTKVDIPPCAVPGLQAGSPPRRKVEAPCTTVLGFQDGSPPCRKVEAPPCKAPRFREGRSPCREVEVPSSHAPGLGKSSSPCMKVETPLLAATSRREVSPPCRKASASSAGPSLRENSPPHKKVEALPCAASSTRDSSPLRRKAYMEPFISKDPLENKDNADPRWEVFRHHKSDVERYQKVRELWQNEVVPDPNLNMTNHARKRFIRECRSVAGEGPVTSTVRLATVAAAARRVLSAGRKRVRQEDDTDQLPPSKRARTAEQITDLTFGLEHSVVCDERVRRNYADLCRSSGRSYSARQMKRITEDYYKKRDLIAVGQDEAEKLHQFYSGLADQGRGLNSFQTQRELREMERLYFAFRRHYNWAGNEFVTIHG